MKFKLFTAQFIQSSDLFKAICDHFQLDSDNFAGEFSDVCTSVSYGDATNTLISMDKFLSILRDMGNFAEADLDEIAAWVPQEVKVDLEN